LHFLCSSKKARIDELLFGESHIGVRCALVIRRCDPCRIRHPTSKTTKLKLKLHCNLKAPGRISPSFIRWTFVVTRRFLSVAGLRYSLVLWGRPQSRWQRASDFADFADSLSRSICFFEGLADCSQLFDSRSVSWWTDATKRSAHRDM